MQKIEIKAITGSKTESIELIADNCYKVKVHIKPESGNANVRIIELLADYFHVPKLSIRIKTGFRSNKKIVEIGE